MCPDLVVKVLVWWVHGGIWVKYGNVNGVTTGFLSGGSSQIDGIGVKRKNQSFWLTFVFIQFHVLINDLAHLPCRSP